MCCLSFEGKKNSFKLGGMETSAAALTKNISVISIWQGLVSWLTTWNQYPFRPPVRPVTPLCSTMSKAAATSSRCWSPITCRVLVSLAQDSDYCNPNLLRQNTRLPHSSQHLAAHKNPKNSTNPSLHMQVGSFAGTLAMNSELLVPDSSREHRGRHFPCLPTQSPLQHHDHLGNQFLRILARPIDIVSTCHPTLATMPPNLHPTNATRRVEIPTCYHHWQSIRSMIRLHLGGAPCPVVETRW